MTMHILKHESKALGNLLKKVEQLANFNNIFAQHIDASLAKHCKVVNFQNHCLIVIVDNGTWATHLRFQIPNLLTKLRNYPELFNIKAICCKIRPNNEQKKSLKRQTLHKVKPISHAVALRTLEKTNTIQDSKLKIILERIINRLWIRLKA